MEELILARAIEARAEGGGGAVGEGGGGAVGDSEAKKLILDLLVLDSRPSLTPLLI